MSSSTKVSDLWWPGKRVGMKKPLCWGARPSPPQFNNLLFAVPASGPPKSVFSVQGKDFAPGGAITVAIGISHPTGNAPPYWSKTANVDPSGGFSLDGIPVNADPFDALYCLVTNSYTGAPVAQAVVFAVV